MQYKILMSYNSLDYRAYKELESLGLKVPFDPKSPESNVYIYQSSESNVPLSKLKSINEGIHLSTFGDGENLIEMVVSEYEVNKHLERVRTVNLPTIGDNVRYSEYKKLVFSVISIEDDIATIQHSLRNVDLILDIPLGNLSLVEKDEDIISYNSTLFPELSRAIYIDSDSTDSDTGKQFALVIRLKTLYKGYEVIFINPNSDLQSLLNELKVSSVYGDPNQVVQGMGYQDLLYSHNLSYLEILPTMLIKEQGDYYSFINEISINNLGFNKLESFQLFNKIKGLYNRKIINQDINFSSLKTKLNQSYDFVWGLYKSYREDIQKELSKPLSLDSELEACIPEGELNYEQLTSILDSLKLHYYIDNIEYYIYIIKS